MLENHILPTQMIPSKKQKRLKVSKNSADEMAQHLHDGVCQTLTAVQLLVQLLMRKMEAGKSADLPSAREINRLLQKARDELVAVMPKA